MVEPTTRDSENILPHNPLKSRGLFAEVKDNIKGKMSWLEFDLRCIMAFLKATNTTNKVIGEALNKLEADAAAQIAKAPAPAPAPAAKPQAKKVTKATNATKEPSKAAPAPIPVQNKKPIRKTLAEVKAANEKKAAEEAAKTPDEVPPTTDDVAELAEIKG